MIQKEGDSMQLVFVRRTTIAKSHLDFLKKSALRMVLALSQKGFRKSLKNKTLTLVFLDKKEAQKLNFQFRAKNYATDVLSFSSMDPKSLGELILCWPVLKKQAKEHGLNQKLELTYMVLHGLLHLLGFDHEEDEALAHEMFELQDAIFADISKRYVNRSRTSLRKKKNHRA
jgi:probable rRNA maturation factor